MHRNWKFLIGFSLLLLFDQVSKVFAVTQGLVTVNTGISFGLLGGVNQAVLNGVLVCFIAVGIWLWRTWLPRAVWSGAFFWAGAVSNVVDRLLVGGVRDWAPIPFLEMKNNMADWYIAVGVILVCWHLFKTDTKNMQER